MQLEGVSNFHYRFNILFNNSSPNLLVPINSLLQNDIKLLHLFH